MNRRFFQMLGLIALVGFSFFYTEKVITVVKEQDPIMQKIYDMHQKYNEKAINVSILGNDGVVPGYNGLSIDDNRSYSSMKKTGKFNNNLLKYREDKPKESITDIYNKYIVGGNERKNMVTFIFKVTPSVSVTQVNKMLSILKQKKVHVTFFVDGKWLENNQKLVTKMFKDSHEIATLGYDGSYDSDFFMWTNNKLEQITRYKIKYCYTDKDDPDILKTCAEYKMHTIKPTVVINDYPFSEVKASLKAGNIVGSNIADNVLKELPATIDLVTNKGYSIETLSTHLSEKRL